MLSRVENDKNSTLLENVYNFLFQHWPFIGLSYGTNINTESTTKSDTAVTKYSKFGVWEVKSHQMVVCG